MPLGNWKRQGSPTEYVPTSRPCGCSRREEPAQFVLGNAALAKATAAEQEAMETQEAWAPSKGAIFTMQESRCTLLTYFRRIELGCDPSQATRKVCTILRVGPNKVIAILALWSTNQELKEEPTAGRGAVQDVASDAWCRVIKEHARFARIVP